MHHAQFQGGGRSQFDCTQLAAHSQEAQQQSVAEEDEWDLTMDMEARKAGLRAQLAAFTKVCLAVQCTPSSCNDTLKQQDNIQTAGVTSCSVMVGNQQGLT